MKDKQKPVKKPVKKPVINQDDYADYGDYLKAKKEQESK